MIKMVKLNKVNNVVMGKLDKMILEESIRNEMNLSSVDNYLAIDALNEDVYMYSRNKENLILLFIDKKNRKERLINVENYRNLKFIDKKDLSSDELRYMVSNL